MIRFMEITFLFTYRGMSGTPSNIYDEALFAEIVNS